MCVYKASFLFLLKFAVCLTIKTEMGVGGSTKEGVKLWGCFQSTEVKPPVAISEHLFKIVKKFLRKFYCIKSCKKGAERFQEAY